jgi:hypothetical protein
MSITSFRNQKAGKMIPITFNLSAMSVTAKKRPLKADNDDKRKTQFLQADGGCRGAGKNKKGKLT